MPVMMNEDPHVNTFRALTPEQANSLLLRSSSGTTGAVYLEDGMTEPHPIDPPEPPEDHERDIEAKFIAAQSTEDALMAYVAGMMDTVFAAMERGNR